MPGPPLSQPPRSGPPPSEPPPSAQPWSEPPEERYFERRQIREAIAFAEAGGIAVHRNFDRFHGRLSRHGVRLERPFVHVIGLRPQLEAWGRHHGLRPEWIQPEGRRRVAHYDVYGGFAQALIDRLAAR